MFVTDFKCLHDFFYACMLTSVSPHHFSNNVSLKLGPFLPRRNRTRHYLLRE